MSHSLRPDISSPAAGQVDVTLLSKNNCCAPGASRYNDRCEICLRARYSSEVVKLVQWWYNTRYWAIQGCQGPDQVV